MWTRARFNNEYIPGLFALSIDTYMTKRATSMYKDLVTQKTSQKKKEEDVIRSGLGLPVVKGEGAAVTYDTQIAGPKQTWVPSVYALAVRINNVVLNKLGELLETPNVKSRTISSQSLKEKVQRLFRKEVHSSEWKRQAPSLVMI